ncbi:SAM-dependent methyltransferase [Bryobacter aggregatus]|uniref:SAM-dependent methyltransferase n=1 Tax=Bryobacter aggregatus TaxID=360054 RepID=UPI0004E27D3F|nr:SAM-dependent methyltransferase [Bryobacter aggregatus]
MSPLAIKIAQRIRTSGPILFSEFMEMALYDKENGYYRGDPFGKDGDFFTASQLQPVFGAYVKALAESLLPNFKSFVDIGAGREELRETFQDRYTAVQQGQEIPETSRSILFSNEFIDALPVDVKDGELSLRVDVDALGQFHWWPHEPGEGVREVRPASRRYLEEAWASIDGPGFYILIDYGYREGDRARFPQGSLMSYRRHAASAKDLLLDPGSRDITAHVDWDALTAEAEEVGWKRHSFSTLRASIIALGPAVLESLSLLGEMQLRTLLFSMGESFEVVVFRKE